MHLHSTMYKWPRGVEFMRHPVIKNVSHQLAAALVWKPGHWAALDGWPPGIYKSTMQTWPYMPSGHWREGSGSSTTHTSSYKKYYGRTRRLFKAGKYLFAKWWIVKLTLTPRIDWYVPGRLNPSEYFDLWIEIGIIYSVQRWHLIQNRRISLICRVAIDEKGVARQPPIRQVIKIIMVGHGVHSKCICLQSDELLNWHSPLVLIDMYRVDWIPASILTFESVLSLQPVFCNQFNKFRNWENLFRPALTSLFKTAESANQKQWSRMEQSMEPYFSSEKCPRRRKYNSLPRALVIREKNATSPVS